MLVEKSECMGKRVYISADYAPNNGDRDVVDVLHRWGNDNKHKVEYVDTAQVVSGSVSNDEDCRPCDLKKEFNAQINASSAVIFIIGDKTACRTAGSFCRRLVNGAGCSCTPYKQNTKGATICKWISTTKEKAGGDVGCINSYSYLEHEFKQAERKKKNIIIIYNSSCRKPSWLPAYMEGYEEYAHPFWKKNDRGDKVGDYQYIKGVLGYE